ncbi:hypothetical protein GP486_006384, partial [Trichoglossum hirsutum]
ELVTIVQASLEFLERGPVVGGYKRDVSPPPLVDEQPALQASHIHLAQPSLAPKTMKLLLTLALTFLAVLPASADFHIVDADARIGIGGSQSGNHGFQLIDSNKFDNCIYIASAPINPGIMKEDDKTPYRNALGGVCGMRDLDFWYRADSDTYDYYQRNGDGTKLGTCYRNNSGKFHSCHVFLSTVKYGLTMPRSLLLN